MKAVIVTGSRDWSDRQCVRSALEDHSPTIVIHGAARGADTVAAHEASDIGATCIPMPAMWSQRGKGAGPKRNLEMLSVLTALKNCGYDVAVLAFPLESSVGTRHMMQVAELAGIPVINYGDWL